MSNNELRGQYRTFEGRAKQGFVSPVGEVDEQQLKEMIAGSGVEPHSTGITMITMISACGSCFTNQCGLSYRPGDVPIC
ncbi:hypothetical protein [Paenibacillus sp. BR1-192]|uniref:hypothetical protein n=1 Tax=Paenibacillus sp. BR1-192 TaxID=3032287 RepID=UPI00240E4D70|nr:hypothetical protein [Paenibacillus sp. BR1-192]WFB58590.1 hypothetical protein P0X86_32550 [Paenibacillus sp. BR1-192]